MLSASKTFQSIAVPTEVGTKPCCIQQMTGRSFQSIAVPTEVGTATIKH
jgi:hypothetical protein